MSERTDKQTVKCSECHKVYSTSETLKAANPFNSEEEIYGCPYCHSINCEQLVCDEPGCEEIATCGFQTKNGYRNTCGKHYKGK